MPYKRCETCSHWFASKYLHACTAGGELRCKVCQRGEVHMHAVSSQQLTPLFDASSEHHRISFAQRCAIIIMHLLSFTEHETAERVLCHVKSVRRWIRHYNWI